MQIQKKSKDHVGFVAQYEYFVKYEILCRALKDNPIVVGTVYRQGARRQMPIRLVDAQYLNLLGLPIDAIRNIKK